MELERKISNGDYVLEGVDCLCGSPRYEVLAEKDRYGIKNRTIICTDCGLIRTSPRMSKESYAKFYSNEYRKIYGDYTNLKKYFEFQRERGKKILKFLQGKIDFKNKTVFELGCSRGGILYSFREAGWITSGCDYGGRDIHYGKNEYGLDLYVGGEDVLLHMKNNFDLVVLSHVIEHLTDPLGALKKIYNKLRDDGLLYILTHTEIIWFL